MMVALGLHTPLRAADPGPELRRAIAAAPAGSAVGIAVINCDTGAWVVQEGADTPLRIASVLKLFVSSAALLELGPEHRFETRLIAMGGREGDRIPALGVLPSGDPCLDEHHSDKQPDRIFALWAEQLHADGLRRIDGDLVIDASLFAGSIRPTTYPDDHANAQRWYSAPASPFAFNDNCIEVRVVPAAVGQPCRVEVRPRSPRIEIRNKTTTVASGGSKGIVVSRDHHANTIAVSGRYSRATAWFPLSIHNSPNLLAGDHLAAALRDRGIAIGGEVVLGPVTADAGDTLLTHHSELRSAVTILNQRSQNFYGEQLSRVLGARVLDDGSVTGGGRAVREVLGAHLGLNLTSLEILDGSGLSYDNQASAVDVCRLLAAMHRHADGDLFKDSLKDKWSGHTLAKVKTGSLAVARCLAGYIRGPEGSYHAFAIILNRSDANSIGWANTLRDKAFEILCRELGSGKTQ